MPEPERRPHLLWRPYRRSPLRCWPSPLLLRRGGELRSLHPPNAPSLQLASGVRQEIGDNLRSARVGIDHIVPNPAKHDHLPKRKAFGRTICPVSWCCRIILSRQQQGRDIQAAGMLLRNRHSLGKPKRANPGIVGLSDPLRPVFEALSSGSSDRLVSEQVTEKSMPWAISVSSSSKIISASGLKSFSYVFSTSFGRSSMALTII